MVISRIPKLCTRPLRFNQSKRASVSATSFRLIIITAPISKFTVALVARARHNLPTFGHCRGDVGYWFLSAHSWMRRVRVPFTMEWPSQLFWALSYNYVPSRIFKREIIISDFRFRPDTADIGGYGIVSVDRRSALLTQLLHHQKSNSDV